MAVVRLFDGKAAVINKKGNYNSLTATGHDAKRDDGNHSDSTMSGMNTGNYTLQKKALREAQNPSGSRKERGVHPSVEVGDRHG